MFNWKNKIALEVKRERIETKPKISESSLSFNYIRLYLREISCFNGSNVSKFTKICRWL